jgi:N-acetylneuraminic acid mutarotase
VGGTDWSSDHLTKYWLNDSVVFRDGSWQAGPSLPHPWAYGMYAWDESGLYLAGGTDGEKKFTTVYHLSDIQSNAAWEKLSSLPVAVQGGAGALLHGVFFITCGLTEDGPTNQMWSLSVRDTAAEWWQCASMPGPARLFPAFVACGKHLYLLGGMTLNSQGGIEQVMEDAYRYDPSNDSWQRLSDLSAPGYAWAGCAFDNNHILLAGKADGQIHKGVWLIDVNNMKSQKIGEAIIQTTTAPLVEAAEGEWWLIAGEPDTNKNRTNKVTIIRAP